MINVDCGARVCEGLIAAGGREMRKTTSGLFERVEEAG
jgi:hypothetical protein